MKVLVAVKRVVDHAVKVRIQPATKRVQTTNVKMAMNPFCEIAMEEAIRLKEKKCVDEIIAVSVGMKTCQEQLRYCMALGADRGILVESKMPMDTDLPPLTVAKALQSVVSTEQPDLVLLGKQSIDGDNGQTGAMLAGLLDWAQASCVSSLQFDKASSSIQVEEDVENGSRTLQVPLPAVVTTDLRLNTPRYPKLPDIVKAKKKPLKVISLESLLKEKEAFESLLKEKEAFEVVKLEEPERKKKGVICKDVDELLSKLHEKGVL
ncbi:electron transfer flavoprotein beta [Blastocystis sp. ATCC 50177/Nand II]|uniref:Electron transfer flavoprotein subunit beta n=1 Tax=Blastocystis sp. subtype 1 (strain ATCC 50177 / NandII) TaxID=478820 RepID=A0A196SHY8_BLAHN|nr:electron transfer flavoprotein beta [Blastocystis sp. ATCC 50177/Nand II]